MVSYRGLRTKKGIENPAKSRTLQQMQLETYELIDEHSASVEHYEQLRKFLSEYKGEFARGNIKILRKLPKPRTGFLKWQAGMQQGVGNPVRDRIERTIRRMEEPTEWIRLHIKNSDWGLKVPVKNSKLDQAAQEENEKLIDKMIARLSAQRESHDACLEHAKTIIQKYDELIEVHKKHGDYSTERTQKLDELQSALEAFKSEWKKIKLRLDLPPYVEPEDVTDILPR